MIQGATLVVMAVLIGVYFFGYVPGMKEYFAQRNLRQLALTADQVRMTVESLPKALTLAARSLEVEPLAEDKEWTNRVKRALELIPTLTLLEDPGVTTNIVALTNSFRLQPRRGAPGGWLQVDYSGVVRANPGGTNPAKPLRVTLRTKCEFEQLVGRPEDFDGLLVAEENGNVLYHRLASGTRLFTLSELRDEKEAPIQNNFPHGASGRQRVRLNGGSFEMFTQPVQLSLPGDATMTNSPNWLVCGLVRSSAFETKSLEILHLYLVGAIFLLFFFAIHLPFLKAGFASVRERLPRFDIFSLALSTISAAALLTFVFLYFLSFHRLQKGLKANLEMLAAQIESNFTNEVSRVRDQLLELSTRPPNSNAYRTDLLITFPDLATRSNAVFFQTVNWIQTNGLQRQKWTVRPISTPLVNVQERAYFHDANANERHSVWSSEDGSFWLESIYAWYSAANSAVLSIRTNAEIIALESQLVSVLRPVLPTGFGFCIVSEDGRVLFHSDPSRVLRENFFDECERNPRLISAVSCRSTNSFELSYVGHRHKVALRPLRNLPWMLMTFSDEHVLSGVSYELVLVALLLFCAYLLVLSVLALVAALILRRTRAAARDTTVGMEILKPLWPTPAKRKIYWLITAINLLAAGLLISLQPSHEHPWLAVIWPQLGPILGAALTLWLLSRPAGAPPAADRPVTWPYLFAAISACLLLGVVPAYGLFKTAYDQRLELHAKQQLFKFSEALIARKNRVSEEYQSIQIPTGDFLNRRLAVSGALDVYSPTNTEFIESSVPQDGGAGGVGEDAEDRTFAWYFQLIGRLRGETPFSTHGVFQGAAGDDSWRWSERDSGRWFESNYGELTLHRKRYRAGEPFALRGKAERLTFGMGLAAFGIMAVLLLGPVYLIARWVFLLNVHGKIVGAAEKLATGRTTENLLVLGTLKPNQSSLREGLPHDTAREGKQLPLIVNLANSFDEDAIVTAKNKVVVLDHLEHQWFDPRVNRRKLRLLDRLIHDPGRTLVVFSTLDPTNFRFPGGATGGGTESATSEEQQQWEALFARFKRSYLEWETEAHYRLRWAISSRDEQLALFQVAKDHFIHPRHPALQTLLARGLLERDPALRLKDSNGDFTQFVRASIDPNAVDEWQREAGGSHWSHLKGPFYLVLLVVALLLFLTQPDIYKLIIGIITGFASGPPAISRLLSLVSKDRGGSNEGAA